MSVPTRGLGGAVKNVNIQPRTGRSFVDADSVRHVPRRIEAISTRDAIGAAMPAEVDPRAPRVSQLKSKFNLAHLLARRSEIE